MVKKGSVSQKTTSESKVIGSAPPLTQRYAQPNNDFYPPYPNAPNNMQRVQPADEKGKARLQKSKEHSERFTAKVKDFRTSDSEDKRAIYKKFKEHNDELREANSKEKRELIATATIGQEALEQVYKQQKRDFPAANKVADLRGQNQIYRTRSTLFMYRFGLLYEYKMNFSNTWVDDEEEWAQGEFPKQSKAAYHKRP